VKRSTRVVAIIAAVIVVLGAGIYIALSSFTSKLNNAIPQTSLFGSSNPSPTASPTLAGMEIPGAMNILLVGIDTRTYVKGWVPHADAVMIMHVDPDHTHVYLTSLPRDLVVNIPAFAPSRFGGESSKLTHAMAFGSLVPGKDPSPAQGFQLLATTVSNYTGIKTWTAGAILEFQGLKKVVDALHGIDVYVDELTVSIHLQPNGAPRPVCGSCDHGYGGPSAVYRVGNMHMVGWQALDYARQRYIPGAAYARERHQRQIIRAMIAKIIHTNYMTNPAAISGLFKALGTFMIFDGRGHQPIDFAFTLRHVTPATMTLVGVPGGSVYSGGNYIGEALGSIQRPFFAAMRSNTLASFLKKNPGLVNKTPQL
jgi:anionic cell wall polymer biosynthesis LytR-Cps2A-Psr (LCP) family protein